jgi:hypothetical protein
MWIIQLKKLGPLFPFLKTENLKFEFFSHDEMFSSIYYKAYYERVFQTKQTHQF